MKPSLRLFLPLAAALCIASLANAAQPTPSPQGGPRLTYATRPQVDSMARAAEDAATLAPAGSDEQKTRRAEAAELRARLAQGDFSAGDRLIVRVVGQPSLSDTFTVREGLILQVPGVGDVSLQGALRSEAQARIRAAIATYYRDPEVAVVPLLRVSVTGGVARSGFYALPADLLLSDAIMAAGGPTNTANLSYVELRRGDRRLYSPKEFSNYVRQGYSLDQVQMRAGDEIHVTERRHSVWPYILQAIGAIAAIVGLTTAVSNHR